MLRVLQVYKTSVPEVRGGVDVVASNLLRYLCLVGVLEKLKGRDIALRPWANLHGDSALLVIGSGSAQAECSGLSTTLGFTQCVHFVGQLPMTRPSRLYGTTWQ